jgi:hypothetical protein
MKLLLLFKRICPEISPASTPDFQPPPSIYLKHFYSLGKANVPIHLQGLLTLYPLIDFLSPSFVRPNPLIDRSRTLTRLAGGTRLSIEG